MPAATVAGLVGRKPRASRRDSLSLNPGVPCGGAITSGCESHRGNGEEAP